MKDACMNIYYLPPHYVFHELFEHNVCSH